MTVDNAHPHLMPNLAATGITCLAALILAGCSSADNLAPPAGELATLEVSSAAFENDGRIPTVHTCDGDDSSPSLAWSAGPKATRSYALIMDDPDAPGGTWVHWVAWNIADTRLAESMPATASGLDHGTNSGGRVGYAGPCPPGPTGSHRYYFKVYALDGLLDLPSSTTGEALLSAIEGHVLAAGELMGRYQRP